MLLTVNGQSFQAPETCGSIADLLALPEWRQAMVIVEHNGTVLNSQQYTRTSLSEGDRIELVHFVGGG